MRTATATVIIGMAAAFVAVSTHAASSSATMTVSAVVVARAIATIESQPASLTISPADLASGYVDVPAAARVHVRTNSANGYLLVFEATAPLFTSVAVAGAGDPVSLPSGNGWVFQPFTATTVDSTLSFRFYLSAGVQPGSYPWPLDISTRTP